MPQRVGGKISKLLGAKQNEVIAADTTSINLFKVVSAALDLRPDRNVIISGMFFAVQLFSTSFNVQFEQLVLMHLRLPSYQLLH